MAYKAAMSQSNVERLIGRLVTDEAFRHRFARDPVATLQAVAGSGCELNRCELAALAGLDPRRLARFAEELDSRLQKIEIQGETSW